MATRLGCRFTENLFSQCGRRPGFDFPSLCTTKRRHQAASVPGGAQKVRGCYKPGELGCRNQSDIAGPSSSYDYSVLLIDHLVEDGGQVLAEAGIRRFARHGSLVP